jgi:hypothetical protein
MKVYIRQIRPYFEPLKLDLYGRIVEGYDKWYPEEEECRLAEELKHYDNLEFEERYVEPLPPRCNKCVYETYCPGKNTDINQTCHNYKRDAPDGGYYG